MTTETTVHRYARCITVCYRPHSGRIVDEGTAGKVTGGSDRTTIVVDGEAWPVENWEPATFEEWRVWKLMHLGRRDHYHPELGVITPDGARPLVGFVMP